jgi:hypothetical protein
VKKLKFIIVLALVMPAVVILAMFGNNTLGQANVADEAAIKSTITKYFASKYESLSTLTEVSIDNFFLREDPVSAKSAQFEKDVRRILVEWRKLRDLPIEKFSLKPNFEEIKISGNNAKVRVFDTCTYQYKNLPFETTESTLHEITLRKVGSSWKIINDFYEDSITQLIRLNKEQGKSIEELFSMLPRFSRNIDTLKNVSSSTFSLEKEDSVVPLGTWWYDRTSAAQHADRYATKDTSDDGYGYDPNYIDFSTQGGDCTNYASQNIRAGGATLNDTTGPYTWYYRNAGGSTADDTWSASWCNVDPLKEYIANNTTNGTPSGYITSDITRLGVGDIIQYNLDSDSAFEHTGFIAYCYKDGLVWFYLIKVLIKILYGAIKP